jgi:DNA-directed RNA polymerase sigma subunit (sigma70/sigma32)
VNDDPVAVYLKEVCQVPPLSDEEVWELALVHPLSESAKERLVEGYLAKVVEIASGFYRSGHHMLDLIQAGNIGLPEGRGDVRGEWVGSFLRICASMRRAADT